MILCIFITSTSFAAAIDLLSLEPIVGYERVQKIAPTPHTNDRLIYGLRAAYGLPYLSAEAEVTQGKDTESFPEDNITIEESVINAKLGLRSKFISTSYYNAFIRAGAHARKSEIETTINNVTTIREPAVRVSPFAGAGMGISFSDIFKLNLGITAIFTGEPRGSDREYQTTAGFSIKL